MPTISTCPRCSRMVSIPEGLEATVLVRCPLCGAEYPLEAAIESLPPQLIPVETSYAKPAGEFGTSPETAGKDSIITAPPIMSSFLSRHGAGEESEESLHSGYALMDNEESVETTESPLDAEVCDLIAKHKQGTEDKFPNQTEPPGLRRRTQSKPKSVPKILMEIAFGGVVGIAIAYIALAWIMGSRFDLPAPPRILKPVLRFVLPDRIWPENQTTRKNP